MATQLTLSLNLNNMFAGFVPDRRLKTCSCCNVLKSVIEFGKDNRTADGKANVCRDCRRKYRRNWACKRERVARTSSQSKIQL